MVGELPGSGSGSDSEFELMEPATGSADTARSPAQRQWTRWVRKLFGVRKFQRIFGFLGRYLQEYPCSLLERLSRQLPYQ